MSPRQTKGGNSVVSPKLHPTVAEFADYWLQTSAAPPFRARYASAKMARFLGAYVLPKIGHVRIDRVTQRRAIDLQRELFRQGLSRGTVVHALVSVAGSMWRDARLEGLTKQQPFQGLRWPRKSPMPPDPFTENEERAIIGYFDAYEGGFYRIYVSMLFGTGARPSEIAGLQIGDYQDGRATIRRGLVARERTPGKTYRALRTIALAPHLVALLDGTIPDDVLPERWLCLAKDGRPLDSTTWSGKRWRQALSRLGIRHRRLYCTRHTYISRALSLGAPPIRVAEYCGTSLAKISSVYAAWVGDQKRDPLTAAREQLLLFRDR